MSAKFDRRFGVRRLLAAVVLVWFASRPAAGGRTQPDQVLVLYNKDWTEDLDGSAPGQDSEEIAQYYVARRTDPATGLKPYLLGLSSKDPARLCLNDTVLKESSSDNWLGLAYRGNGPLVCDPWPLCNKSGPRALPYRVIAEGQGNPRFAAAFIAQNDLGDGTPREFRIMITGPDGRSLVLLDAGRNMPPHPALSLVQIRPGGLLALIDCTQLRLSSVEVSLTYTPASGDPLTLSGVCKPDPDKPLRPIRVLDKRQEGPRLPERTSVVDHLISEPEVLTLTATGEVFGIVVHRADLKDLDEDTLVLRAGASDRESEAQVLFANGAPATEVDVSVYRTVKGDMLLSCDYTERFSGTVWVWLAGSPRPGAEPTYRRQWVLHEVGDFTASETGPDGARDDQAYVDNIETPVREFLENNRTADGKLLKDHVLYFVIARGLPLQVRSLYGIERGPTTVEKRSSDFGAGSALTQRIRMLYYDLPAFCWAPTVMLNGGGEDGGVAHIGHPVTQGLTGAAFNPYQHPLTHNEALRNLVWSRGRSFAVKQMDPPPLTSALRASAPREKFLYGAGRIDAPTVALAKAQIDGAIYGERHFTPGMGPTYYGAYQEGPFTAEALRPMGFKIESIPRRADRCLLYFGVFGYGALCDDEIGADKGREVVWEKGFLPGSIGIGIRSFLGWDQSRPPREEVQLFDQLVRAGVTITAGSAGGSHETNASWWDSFVMTRLLFSGYEYGDAALRSMVYLDGTIDLVGDPLYAPDLAHTEPDAAAPRVAAPGDISLSAVDSGGGRFALLAAVRLSNDGPEMAEIAVTCREKSNPGLALSNAETRYRAAPEAFVTGLKPATDYLVSVVLTDPYGNAFDSEKAFGPLAMRTGAPRAAAAVTDRAFDAWDPGTPVVLDLPAAELDERGEIRLDFTAGEPAADAAPTLIAESGAGLLSPAGGFRVGGAQMSLKVDNKPVFEPGRDYRLVLRWRRFPVTREALLVTPDGTEFVLNRANNLPWNPAETAGRRLTLKGACAVKRIVLRDDAPAAPPERRSALRPRFDAEGFRDASRRRPATVKDADLQDPALREAIHDR